MSTGREGKRGEGRRGEERKEGSGIDSTQHTSH